MIGNIGWVDKLGSGVGNIFKYNKIYSDSEPIFIEDDLFKTIIPLVSATSDQASDQADEDIKRLLQYCKIPRSREEMQQFMGLSHRGYLLQYNGSILILKGVYYCEMERSYKRLS